MINNEFFLLSIMLSVNIYYNTNANIHTETNKKKSKIN